MLLKALTAITMIDDPKQHWLYSFLKLKAQHSLKESMLPMVLGHLLMRIDKVITVLVKPCEECYVQSSDIVRYCEQNVSAFRMG